MKIKPVLGTIFFIALAAGSFFLYRAYSGIRGAQVLQENKKMAWLELQKKLEHRISNFQGAVGLEIIDLDSGREISFNKDMLFPSASLVKIPIMMSCFYAAEEGKIKLTDTLKLKASQKVGGSKVLGQQPTGATFTVQDLLGPMITQSDNAATNLLIDFLGFDTLNDYFKKIGLKNTNLSRKMMDFKERRAGEENYTTAQDMAYLLDRLYRRDFLNQNTSEQCLVLLGQQKINDRIPRKLPKEGAFIAHKTGLERRICHDVGIVFTRNGNFIICALVRHKSKTALAAKRLISDLALLTFQYYHDHTRK